MSIWGKESSAMVEAVDPHRPVNKCPAVIETTAAVRDLREQIAKLDSEWQQIVQMLNTNEMASLTRLSYGDLERRMAMRRKPLLELELQDAQDQLSLAERAQRKAIQRAKDELREARNAELRRLYQEATKYLDQAETLLQEAAQWEADGAALGCEPHLPIHHEFTGIGDGETLYRSRCRILREQGLL